MHHKSQRSVCGLQSASDFLRGLKIVHCINCVKCFNRVAVVKKKKKRWLKDMYEKWPRYGLKFVFSLDIILFVDDMAQKTQLTKSLRA